MRQTNTSITGSERDLEKILKDYFFIKFGIKVTDLKILENSKWVLTKIASEKKYDSINDFIQMAKPTVRMKYIIKMYIAFFLLKMKPAEYNSQEGQEKILNFYKTNNSLVLKEILVHEKDLQKFRNIGSKTWDQFKIFINKNLF